MADRLQELTEKIYQEGIDKAKSEGEKIIADARKQAEDILKKAQQDAHQIVADADARSQEIRKNVQSEVQLAAKQAISAIKQKIADLIIARTIEPKVEKAFQDGMFLKEVIKTAISRWNPGEDGRIDLELMLPKDMKETMDDYFRQEGQSIARSGLVVQFDENIHAGFKLGPTEGGYKISFTEEDFENFFKDYLRPRTIRVLYGD